MLSRLCTGFSKLTTSASTRAATSSTSYNGVHGGFDHDSMTSASNVNAASCSEYRPTPFYQPLTSRFSSRGYAGAKSGELPEEFTTNSTQRRGGDYTKRSFAYFVAGATGFVYALSAKQIVTDLVDQMNPAADVLALASVEVDLSAVPEGTTIPVKWRGKPLFIRHRTEAEIKEAQETPLSALPDKEEDAARVKNPKYLVVVGVCTHLGRVPMSGQGDYHGWFCPCHGSHYDVSGRIRKGPAPANLLIPPYKFTSDTTIVVG